MAPNLHNMLVRADLLVPQPTHCLSNILFGNFKCGCSQQCNFTFKTQTFNHPSSSKFFKIRGTIVVYLLHCPCGLGYVGKTSRQLKTRIAEHRCAIRHHDPRIPVAHIFLSLNIDINILTFKGYLL